MYQTWLRTGRRNHKHSALIKSQALAESCVTRQQHPLDLSDATGKTVIVAHRKLCLKDHMEVSAWLH